MENEKEIFESLKQEISSHMREYIFTYDYLNLNNHDSVVYVWFNLKQWKILYFFTEPDYLDEDDILLFVIKKYWKSIDKIDYEELYYEIYSILTWKTKDEVKEYIKKDFEIDNWDFEQIYSDLITSMKQVENDWLLEWIIVKLSSINELFSDYMEFRRIKEYVKQKLETNELIDFENYIKNLNYEDLPKKKNILSY